MRKYTAPVPGHAVAVDEIPPCEVCGTGKPAEFIACLSKVGGRWAYVCYRHWAMYSSGRTGVDEGQQLLLRVRAS